MKSERNKGLYLCFLSALTGMAPIVVVTTMIFVGEGGEDGRWWYWVSMIVADLTLASVVVGFHEGRPFSGWDAESRNEVQKMMFRANMMGMCLECGYQDDTNRWGWRNPSI